MKNPASPNVLVVDFRPLSLLTTAGVLHPSGMRCVCAGSIAAVRQALGLDPPSASSGPVQRVDPPQQTVGESASTADVFDLIVWDVGDHPSDVLETLAAIRQIYQDLPAVLIAETKWAGLETRTEAMAAATHCLYKPIDPKSLIAVAEQALWMPSLHAAHRRRGSRPARPGWVGLS